MASSHPYEEPSLAVILVIFGFLFLLNVVNKILDSLLYCGLVGQIFVGVLFGTPGVQLLSITVETTVSDLGYLGLILLVYEGGLSTSFAGLVSCSILATVVALTGILVPIALSFVLLSFGATPLQCFAAGASLSATSLGTAFATLSTSGLLSTPLGTVLTTAAMLDDVVGLIMLQVVAELSGGRGTPSDYGKVIGRALGASVGLVISVALVFRFVLRPVYMLLGPWACAPKRSRVVTWIWQGPYTALLSHTALLLALVVVGSVAGTSLLLAAFVAGVVVRWWGDEVAHSEDAPGLEVYQQFYGAVADRILKPFFFASIGFSIPISQMFRAATIWKGLVYALLMFLGKLATGLWLVPHSLETPTRLQIQQSVSSFWRQNKRSESKPSANSNNSNADEMEGKLSQKDANPRRRNPLDPDTLTIAHAPPNHTLRTLPSQPSPAAMAPELAHGNSPSHARKDSQNVGDISILPSPPSKPLSLPAPPDTVSSTRPDHEPENPPDSSPPAAMNTSISASAPTAPPRRALRVYSPALIGLAMTARGEIGFLITSVAESHGIFATAASTSGVPMSDVDMSSTLYLIVVWAIVLCTIVGPIATGGLVRRVNRLDIQTRD